MRQQVHNQSLFAGSHRGARNDYPPIECRLQDREAVNRPRNTTADRSVRWQV